MTDPFSEDCIRLSGTSKTHSHLNDAFHSVSVRLMFAERMGGTCYYASVRHGCFLCRDYHTHAMKKASHIADGRILCLVFEAACLFCRGVRKPHVQYQNPRL